MFTATSFHGMLCDIYTFINRIQHAKLRGSTLLMIPAQRPLIKEAHEIEDGHVLASILQPLDSVWTPSRLEMQLLQQRNVNRPLDLFIRIWENVPTVPWFGKHLD